MERSGRWCGRAAALAATLLLGGCERPEPFPEECLPPEGGAAVDDAGLPGADVLLARVEALYWEQDFSLALRCLSAFPRERLGGGVEGANGLYLRGVLHKLLARPDSGLHYLLRADSAVRDLLAASPGDVDARWLGSDVAHTLGTVYDDLGRYGEAVEQYERSMADPELLEPADRAVTVNNIGVLRRRMGDPERAIRSYREALELDPSREGALFHMNIGLALGDLGRDAPAREAFGRAVEEARRSRDLVRLAESWRHVAALLHRSARPDRQAALVAYDSAAAAYARLLEPFGDDRDRVDYLAIPDLVSLHPDWALAVLEEGGEGAVRRALDVADEGRSRALRALLGAGPGAPANGGREPDGADLPRSFLLYQMASPPALADGDPPDELTLWWRLRGGPVRVRRCLTSGAELGQRVGGFLEQNGVTDAAATGRVTRSAAARERLMATEHRSGRDNRIRPRTSAPRPPACPALSPTRFDGADLGRLLLPDELVEALRPGDELVLLPHGPLWALPFSLLPAGDRPLGVRVALRYAHSLELHRLLERTDPGPLRPGDGLVVADPTMPTWDGHRLAPLPGAAAEGEWIASATGATLLTGERATEDRLVELAGRASFLHLATHGVAFRSAARARDSFVALAPSERDGLLTVSEVLDPASFPDLSARLVVLSACQTGTGDVRGAEGTVGLARSFLARGARAGLFSLWSVSDRDTDRLMRSFYREWLGGEVSAAEALRRAQAELWEETPAGWRWAGFQLFGAG